MKNHHEYKSKVSKASVSTSTQDFKPYNKARKETKRLQQKNKRNSTNLATKVNVVEVGNQKKKMKDVMRLRVIIMTKRETIQPFT